MSLLKQLNLNSNEAKIYLFLLQSGPNSVQSISRAISIPRSTIYQRVEKLKRIGLVEEMRGEKGQIIKAVHPQKIKQISEIRYQKSFALKSSVKEVLPELLKMYQPEETKAKIVHFEGVKGIKRMIYNYELEAKSKHLYGYTTNDIVELLDKKFMTEYHKKFIKKGYRDNFIVSDAPENSEYLKSFKNLLVYRKNRIKVRVLNHKIFNPKVNVSIYDDKYAIALIKAGKAFGVIIQSEDIANHQMETFKILWEKAKDL